MEGKDNRHKARLNFVSTENIASREVLRAGCLISQHFWRMLLCSYLLAAGLGEEGSRLLGTREHLWLPILHFSAFIDEPKSMNAAVPSSGLQEEWQRRSTWSPIGPSTPVKDWMSLSQQINSFPMCNSELRISIKYKLLIWKNCALPLSICNVNRTALSYGRRTRNTVRKASDKHVRCPCWQGHTSVYTMLFTPFLMSRLLWALWGRKGLTFEGLPGSFHHIWLQMRFLEGAA